MIILGYTRYITLTTFMKCRKSLILISFYNHLNFFRKNLLFRCEITIEMESIDIVICLEFRKLKMYAQYAFEY